MRSMGIIVMLELGQFRLQIDGCPEQGSVEVLTPDRPNQPFYERMRKPHVRDSLEFRHLKVLEDWLSIGGTSN